MNILHIVSSIDPKMGGVSQAITSMIEALSIFSDTNSVLCLDDPNEQYVGNYNYKTFALGPVRNSWKYSTDLKTWLENNINNYNIIIIHGIWQYHTCATYQVWKKNNFTGPKVFIMPHGMLDPWFQKSSKRKIKAIRNWLVWKLFEHKLINKATGLLFTCETEKVLARKTFIPYNPKLEKVIGISVDFPPKYAYSMQLAFEKACNCKPKDFILFAGRIHPKKGVDLLIQAYIDLKKNGLEMPKLVVAGPGLDTSYGLEILQKASFDHDIIFPGMLTGDAKWGAFYGCSVFILPSHQENFGIAVVEAMASGKPVLISNQVNIYREISSSQSGFVVNDSLEGTTQVLKTWVNLPQNKRMEMAYNAYKTYQDVFSLEKVSENLRRTLV